MKYLKKDIKEQINRKLSNFSYFSDLKRKFLLFNFLLYIKKLYISEDNGISNYK